MKKILAALLIVGSLALLAGCGTAPTDPVVPPAVIHYKYIVTTVPASMLTLPAPVPPLNTQTATDKDASIWILDNEQRTEALEDQLKAIQTYLSNKIKNLNLPPADVTID